MKQTITPQTFLAATGRMPEHDDLDRCNCEKSGEIGHFCCGWDEKSNLPFFDGRRLVKKTGEI